MQLAVISFARISKKVLHKHLKFEVEERRMNLSTTTSVKKEKEDSSDEYIPPTKHKRIKNSENAQFGHTVVSPKKCQSLIVKPEPNTSAIVESTSRTSVNAATEHTESFNFSSPFQPCLQPTCSRANNLGSSLAFSSSPYFSERQDSTRTVTSVKSELTHTHTSEGFIAQQILDIEKALNLSLQQLSFPNPVTHVYNPLEYAAATHADYVYKYGNSHKKVLFLGMNPGPFGMAQNGVPFGVSSLVRDWLKITGRVHKPANEHPKRPILGLDCRRDEVSGSRFWGFIQKRCGCPEAFFRNCYVHNICPLVFMNHTGKNITPPQLPAVVRNALNTLCDSALYQIIELLQVDIVVGVGKFAADRTMKVLKETELNGVRVETLMHPSPANPVANKGWEAIAEVQLGEIGVLPLLIKDNG